MPTSVELRAQMMTVWNRMKEINDAGPLDEEAKANWTLAQNEFMDLKAAVERQEFLENTPLSQMQDAERRIWQIEQDAKSSPTDEADAVARQKRAYAQAFRQYMSAQSPRMLPAETWNTLYAGAHTLSDEEKAIMARVLPADVYRNAMSTSSQTGGGFWVPDEMMEAVEKAMLFYGGMSRFAETITTDTGGDLPWPVYNDTGNVGRRLSQNTAATQTDLSVGLVTFKAHTYSSDEVLVSLQLLQDWPVQADSIITDALGERIGRVQNTDFTSNGSPDGPQGLITATTLGVTAAATGAVTADELRNLKYSVDRAYREHPSAAYMAHDTTVRDIMGLKDGDGEYLFMPDPRQGGEPTIWGQPVIVNNDMPTMATTAKAVVYGKGAAYKIRRVKGFTLLRMDERYAPQLSVSFLGFARADGGYIDAGTHPIKHLAMA